MCCFWKAVHCRCYDRNRVYHVSRVRVCVVGGEDSMNQREFVFDPPDRLTGQRAKIIERLQAGPASNAELTAIAMRYSARIHELRKCGYDIRIVRQDRESGLVWYDLV
jgi:hypothetical protein